MVRPFFVRESLRPDSLFSCEREGCTNNAYTRRSIMSATALAEPPVLSDPQSLQLLKRNGTLVGFNPAKISVAVTKAFLSVEGDKAAGSARITDAVHRVTEQVVQA